MKWMDIVSAIARQKLGKPEDWTAYRFARIGETSDMIVHGAIPRPLKSGPRKGRETWREKVELSSCCVTEAEIAAFRANAKGET